MAKTPILTPRMARAVERLRAGEVELRDRHAPQGPKEWGPARVTKRGIGWRLRTDLVGAGMMVADHSRIHPNRRYRTLEYDDGEPTGRGDGMTYGVLLDREGLLGFVKSEREESWRKAGRLRSVRIGEPKYWLASLNGRFPPRDRIGFRYETRDEAALAIVRHLREKGSL